MDPSSLCFTAGRRQSLRGREVAHTYSEQVLAEKYAGIWYGSKLKLLLHAVSQLVGQALGGTGIATTSARASAGKIQTVYDRDPGSF